MTEVTGGLLPGVDVSRETEAVLRSFMDRVLKWTSKINLVSRKPDADMLGRHINDSAQLFPYLRQDQTTWVDLGSGGGFPGLVVAILAQDQRPDVRVTLIEADRRKATFLRMIASEFALNVTVLSERIESAPPQSADIVSARALARLTPLLGLVERHLAPNGTALLLKGAGHLEEIAEARGTWQFTVEAAESATHAGAAVLRIKDIRRV